MPKKKIMIIDDEAGICDILKKLFQSEGYEVIAVTDSEKAIDMIKKENPCCILLDIKMPKVSGMDILSKVREYDDKINIIMITGYGTLESAVESMRLGAFDYITKPFDMEYIKNLVERCTAR